jgi:DNA-binding response OmpR family regulator
VVVDVASVHQLHPVRVLVAGDDERFVARTTETLTALGFDVISTTSAARAPELAAVERVNVVLLDASRGVSAAAATASALDALPSRVSVLLAGGRGRTAARLGYDVIGLTASAEELCAAVHGAYRGRPRRAGGAHRL